MLTRILEKIMAMDVIDRTISRAIDADPERPVFASLRDAFGLGTDVDPADLARIPRSGPVIFVCNHPSGFAEALVVPALIDALRDDMTVVAHQWFERWPALARRMILVNPQSTGGRNTSGLKEAVRWVRGGRALINFPAGEVAHGRPGSFESDEKPWRLGLAAMVRLTGASVVPIHAEMTNRRRFHVLSWLHPRLGSLLLCRELLAQRGRPVRLRVGKPLTVNELRKAKNPAEVAEICRRAVLALGCRPAAQPRVPHHTGIEKECAVNS